MILHIGDRVQVARDVAEQWMTRGGPRRKPINWLRRQGMVFHFRRGGDLVDVIWDGRGSADTVPGNVLELVARKRQAK